MNVAGECDRRTDPASSVPEPLASSTPLVAHPCSWMASSLHAQMFRGPVSGPLFSPLRGQLPPPLHHHPCRSSPKFRVGGGTAIPWSLWRLVLTVCQFSVSKPVLSGCVRGRAGLSARGAGVSGAGHPGL